METCSNCKQFLGTLSYCYEEKMSTIFTLFLLLKAILVSAQFNDLKPNKEVPELNQHCMNCICQASSNCDESTKCHQADGGGGYLCGPYVVSWAYWYEGGRPGYTGKTEDFETCVTNRTCAEQAVRGYMRRYGWDCDADGLVDCHDFARIHKVGSDQCSNEKILYTEYWLKFALCRAISVASQQKYAAYLLEENSTSVQI